LWVTCSTSICARLSGGRDGHRSSVLKPGATAFDDVVDLLNHQNGTGVSHAERLSPRVMTDLLEVRARVVISGDAILVEPMLGTRSVMV
jgi:hypothetical protein